MNFKTISKNLIFFTLFFTSSLALSQVKFCGYLTQLKIDTQSNSFMLLTRWDYVYLPNSGFSDYVDSSVRVSDLRFLEQVADHLKQTERVRYVPFSNFAYFKKYRNANQYLCVEGETFEKGRIKRSRRQNVVGVNKVYPAPRSTPERLQ